MKKKSLDWEENTWFLIEIVTKMILEEIYGERSAKYFKVDFFSFHCATFHSLPRARRTFTVGRDIWSSLDYIRARWKRGEENLEKGFYCSRRIIGFYQWVCREPRSGSLLLRRSSVLFASHLAAHFQFDAARAFRGLLYSSTISQAYCLCPYIPGENSWGLPWLANYRREMAAIPDSIIDPSRPLLLFPIFFFFFFFSSRNDFEIQYGNISRISSRDSS